MQKVTVIELTKNGVAEEAFHFKEIERPKLAPSEVRIAVEASGLNFAEVLARRKLYPEAPKLPFVPGYEVVGRVLELGSEVRTIQVGQRVVSGCQFGGYASEITVDEIFVIPIPEDFDSNVALSAVTQGQTALLLFEHAVRVYEGELVLIHAAAGGVGTMLCQLALNRGCEVIGTCGSEEKVRMLEEMGVQHAVDYRKSDFVKEIKRRLPRRRVDVAFDSLGGSTLRRTYALLGAGGRLATYGIADAAGGKRANLSLLTTVLGSGLFNPISLLSKSKTISGVNILHLLKHKRSLTRSYYEQAYRMIEDGVIKPRVGATFAAQDVAKAHRFLEERKAMGKVSLTWGNA